MSVSKVHVNGAVSCPHCHGKVSSYSGFNGARGSQRYLLKHMERCETASAKDRAYYRQNGRWPRR